jgi:Flp pilus assembly protein TadD
LARHYQIHRDAEGQFRVFRRLHLLHPQDPAVGNNFSYFAALNGREQRLAEQVARENFQREPANPLFAATLAFNFFMQGRSQESFTLIQPFAKKSGGSPAVSFVYGLALAGTGRKAEAHALLDDVPVDTMSIRESEVIKTALKN